VTELVVTALIIAASALAILAVEVKDLLYAVLCLCGMSIAVGALFGILSASLVMVFQLLIYAGASIALFVSVIILTSRGGDA
jgi:NADH:ubiquinone oxidoreductase subunit 6 (subunit J)